MLGWSINLFRLFGIQLAVHASFFILLAFHGWDGWRAERLAGVVENVGLILAFFVCVVLHELGHSLTARRFGVRVPRILLTPIGGIAEFDRIPTRPKEELLITVNGPLVNFVIALVLILVAGLPPGLPFHPVFADSARGFTQLLLYWNILMGCFNLLPIFPMDGGRILRALLALRQPYVIATFWAARIGQTLSLILAGVAFYHTWWLTGVLFAFIHVMGGMEYRIVRFREQQAAERAECARKIQVVRPEDGPTPRLGLHGPN